jgi:hypothetical protein
MIVADLTVTRCAECGCNFGVPGDFLTCRRNDKRDFYCPNGHVLSYRQSEAEKLRLERDRLLQSLAQKEDELKDLENRRRAALGQVTKLRNRVGNGVCPCCTRSFTNLRRHMETQHPDFRAEAAE